jgi:hypothetical protein
MPGRTGMQQTKTAPCGQERPAWDVAGRVNDLINCYLSTAGEYLGAVLPMIVIGIVLIVIMLLAAREVIKE